MKKFYALVLIISFGININLSSQTNHWKDVEPMPLPEYTPPLSSGHHNQIVEYDMVTQNLRISELDSTATMSLKGTPGSMAHIAQETVDGIESFSQLKRVSDDESESYPFSSATKLIITFPNGKRVSCSGTMVDTKSLLTCGHCIYSHDNGGWATNVMAMPGYNNNGDFQPFGAAHSINLTTFTSWVENEDYNGDIAIVVLNRPVGALSGWLGYGYLNSVTNYLDRDYHTTGYPAATPYDGGEPYYRNGRFDFNENDRLLYSFDKSYGGQSGSGVYHKDGNGDRFVHAVLSHGNGAVTGYPRFNSGVFNTISEQIEEYRTSQHDLVPLWTYTSEYNYMQGEDLDVHFFALNDGSRRFNGRIDATVYLSRDKYIDPSDISLGSITSSTTYIDSRQTKHVMNESVRIHGNVPPGKYYVGIVLNNRDGDASDNSNTEWDVDVIRVNRSLSTSSESVEVRKLTIHPNPVKGACMLHKNGEDALSDLTLYNMAGKKIKTFDTISSDNEFITLSMHNLLPGKYLLRGQINGRPFVKKVVKI